MKKFIAAMVAVMVMVIGCGAFAETLPDFVSAALENDYNYLGQSGIIDELIETEMPCKSASAICFTNGGYYFEYKDDWGDIYGWYDAEMSYHDSMTYLSVMLATLYDNDYITIGVITNMNGTTFMLAPLEINEYTFNDTYDFFDAVTDEIVFGS